MVEELYVIKNDERYRLDLNTPSGITLNFKSNIFGDLSKITCSYSYTFKLPHTLNNRLVLDSAEDIRHESNMVRKKLVAEFYQNGIKIFDDANLYIDTIQGGYAAVLTWGVVRGMEALKDNDVSLRELTPLTGGGIARFGIKTAVPRPTDWTNEAEYYIPYRTSEGSYFYSGQRYIYGYEVTSGSTMLPVVPVKRLIDMINAQYGTQFYFGGEVKGSNLWNSSTHSFAQSDVNELIAYGAVPLVKRDLTDEEYAVRTGTLKNIQVLDNSLWGIAPLKIWDDCRAFNVISFEYQAPQVNDYFDIGNNGSTSGTTRKYTFFKKSNSFVEEVELNGYIRVTMANIGSRWKGSKLDYARDGIIPKLIVYKRTPKLKEGSSTNYEIVYEEAVTLEGKLVGVNTFIEGEYTFQLDIFEFDFRGEAGRNRIKLENFNQAVEAYPYFMSINDAVQTVDEVSDFKIIPSGNMSDNFNKGWEVDIMSNLPDISCLTFMKSLYYMMGAFPSLDAEGRIVPLFYSDIYKKIAQYEASDWSDKLTSKNSDVPEKIAFSVSGFGQKNYYLMKNDSLEPKNSNEREDVYESGMGCIVCKNETLDKAKTIIQIPFYGAFLQDASRPKYDTGHDMKYKKFNDDDSTSFCEAKPAIGIVRPIEQFKYGTTNPPTFQGLGTYTMLLHIWDGFKNIEENGSYESLQQIMMAPVVITECLNLSELDLRDIDYTKPIYLNKYNSFFAVVSIQRDNKGKCKCELIKIPLNGIRRSN